MRKVLAAAATAFGWSYSLIATALAPAAHAPFPVYASFQFVRPWSKEMAMRCLFLSVVLCSCTASLGTPDDTCGAQAKPSKFPDFRQEDLVKRSKHFTTSNVAWASWTEEGLSDAPTYDDVETFAFKVPPHAVNVIPDAILDLLGVGSDHKLVVIRNFDLLEICAGAARPSRLATILGLKPAAFDVLYSPAMDILTDEGFAIAVGLLLRVKEKSLCLMGPQCSSWTWMCRSVTRRTKWNVDGDVNNRKVRDGNRMNHRISILGYIAFLIGVFFVIENPLNSLFFKTMPMTTILEAASASYRCVRLIAFGGATVKPLALRGTAPWLKTFGAPASSALKKNAKAKAKKATTTLVTRARNGGVTGNKKAMSESKVYPVSFCMAIMKAQWPDRFL